MTRQEHLMTIAMEECNELAQRLSKSMRFGWLEVQPGQSLTNYQRLRAEYVDLVALMEMLNVLPPYTDEKDRKKAKVLEFLRYSKQCGTLAAVESPGRDLRVGLEEPRDTRIE